MPSCRLSLTACRRASAPSVAGLERHGAPAARPSKAASVMTVGLHAQSVVPVAAAVARSMVVATLCAVGMAAVVAMARRAQQATTTHTARLASLDARADGRSDRRGLPWTAQPRGRQQLQWRHCLCLAGFHCRCAHRRWTSAHCASWRPPRSCPLLRLQLSLQLRPTLEARAQSLRAPGTAGVVVVAAVVRATSTRCATLYCTDARLRLPHCMRE